MVKDLKCDSLSVISVIEYKQRILNKHWINALKLISLLKQGRVSECRKLVSAWKDSSGHVFYRGMLCQERDHCPVRARVYTESLVADAIDTIGKVSRAVQGKLKFASVEFTIPGRAWNRVKDEELAELRRMAWGVLKEILGESDEKGNYKFTLAGVGSAHYWHSSEPFEGWYPHVHFTLLEVAYDEKEQAFRKLNLFLTQEQLDRMSKLWRAKFEARYGKVQAKRFVVHWHYSTGYGHLRHRLSYAMRRSVIDAYKTVCKMGSIEGIDVSWLQRMLNRPKKEKRVQWFGRLSDGVKKEYLAKLDIVLEKKALRDKERRRVFCPYCGDELKCFDKRIPLESLSGLELHASVLAFARVGSDRGGIRRWRG